MIYNIPIESLEERYSQQWNSWFPKEFNRFNIQFKSIYPKPITEIIKQGAFLDVIGTNHFKATQLRIICELFWENKIMPGDIFFFHDLWFPGIEMLAYMRDALKIDFKICGILHAGCWDEHDMLFRSGMNPWAAWIEMGWLHFIDRMFVATQFHKTLLLEKRNPDKVFEYIAGEIGGELLESYTKLDNKIHITGLPIYPEFANPNPLKRFDVIFPHRLDTEKNPEDFALLSKLFRDKKDWNFFRTKDIANTKQEYYNVLNNASVAMSFSDQETWGIAMQEAVMCGCIPLVPDRLSYQEMYPSEFRFTNFGHCVDKLRKLMDDKTYFNAMKVMAEILSQKFIMKGRMAIEKMLTVMEEI